MPGRNTLLAGWLSETGFTKRSLRRAIVAASGIDVSERQIARWTNESRTPHEPLPGIIAGIVSAAAGYQITPQHLGWPARGNKIGDTGTGIGAGTEHFEEPQESPVLRRQLLQIIIAGGVGMSDDTRRALDRTRALMDSALASSTSTTQAIAAFEERADGFGHGYHGRAPGAVLPGVVADFLEAQSVLSRQLPGSQRARMCRVAGQLAGVTAAILHDQGEHAEALAWFGTGVHAAGQAGDSELTTWLHSREAMIHINYGDPADAVRATRHALKGAPSASPSAAVALTHAVQARALALSGDHAGALGALNTADGEFERLRPEQTSPTWWAMERQKHLVHLSHALSVIPGSTARAEAVQREALGLTGETSHLTRALLHLDHAACRIRDGHLDDGVAEASEALVALPAGFGTGLVASRARAVEALIPAGARRRSDVAEYVALLR